MSETTPTVGERLKAERERRGMSTQKVADEMHLDAWVIDALETGDYQRIGPMVYARGHLKRYASILGLPAALVAAGSETQTPISAAAASAPAVVMRMPRAAAPIRAPWPQIVTVVLIVLAAVAVAWWRPWQHRSGTARPVAQNAAAGNASAPSEPAAETASSPVASNGASGNDASAAGTQSPPAPPADEASAGTAASIEAPAPSGASAATRAPAAAELAPGGGAPLPGAGRARLRLSFSADSWVEVHDATGRRVFAGNGRANSVQTIAGMAPLTVYLGFAGGVQLEVNDRAVAIGPQFVSGDVARFEAGADGVLRRDTRPAPAQGASARAGSPHG